MICHREQLLNDIDATVMEFKEKVTVELNENGSISRSVWQLRFYLSRRVVPRRSYSHISHWSVVNLLMWEFDIGTLMCIWDSCYSSSVWNTDDQSFVGLFSITVSPLNFLILSLSLLFSRSEISISERISLISTPLPESVAHHRKLLIFRDSSH